MPSHTVSINLPIGVPTPERMEEIYREECARIAALRATWCTFDEAADYLRMSPRTFERRKVAWGIPVMELNGSESPLKVVYRHDLDAFALSKIVKGARPLCAKCGEQQVIEFPSVAAHEELLKRGAA